MSYQSKQSLRMFYLLWEFLLFLGQLALVCIGQGIENLLSAILIEIMILNILDTIS